jgi:hypothetical protein
MPIVIKNIRGRRYYYSQQSRRVSGRKHPVSDMVYLGPVDGVPRRKGILGRIGEFIAINLQHDFIVSDELLQRGQKERDAERNQKRAEENERLVELYVKYGLWVGPRNPVPIEKPDPISATLLSLGATTAPKDAPPDTAAVATDAPDAPDATDGEADT